MPKVKLLRVSDSSVCDDEIRHIIGYDKEGWEDVSEEDLALLKKHKYELYRFLQENFVIVEQLEAKEVIENSVPKLLKLLKDEQDKLANKQKKYKEEEKKRKEKLEAKKIEKAQKLLKEKGII